MDKNLEIFFTSVVGDAHWGSSHSDCREKNHVTGSRPIRFQDLGVRSNKMADCFCVTKSVTWVSHGSK